MSFCSQTDNNVPLTVSLSSWDCNHQISSIDIFSMSDMSRTVALGFWDSKRISVFDVSFSDEWSVQLITQTEPLLSVARSVILVQLETSRTNLIVGLACGSAMIFVLESDKLCHQRTIALGERPVEFCLSEIDSSPAVFCWGTQAAVIKIEKNRLQSTSVILQVTRFVARYGRSHTLAIGRQCCTVFPTQRYAVLLGHCETYGDRVWKNTRNGETARSTGAAHN